MNEEDKTLTEEKIRFMFEQVYLQNNKQTCMRGEHGNYVHPSIEDTWCGFKGAFEYIIKPGFGYYAFKNPNNFEYEWCISYIQDWDEDGVLSNIESEIKINNFEETSPNELVYYGNGSAEEELTEEGFIILHDPIWEFDPRFKNKLK